jgi:hypothetical protein
VGFLGAIAALGLAAAIWFAVFQPISREGLVWGGVVYGSKPEFMEYLRTKGLSYQTWLRRNPGVAPWEPRRRTARSAAVARAWDWKRDALLALNAALLATIAAALLAYPVGSGWQRRVHRSSPPGRPRGASSAGAAAKASVRGLGYIGIGARELTHVAVNRVDRTHANDEVFLYVVAVALALALGVLISLLLA